jgi:TM2 domain-containing membrane protein YozV
MSESPSTASNVTQGEARMKGPDEKFCQECGNIIRVKAEICPKCGVRQAGSVLKFERSRLVAAGLAFFLGGLGFHKFYLGKLGMGIVYLLFCWTFVPMIAGFLESISYLVMTDEQFGEKYG